MDDWTEVFKFTPLLLLLLLRWARRRRRSTDSTAGDGDQPGDPVPSPDWRRVRSDKDEVEFERDYEPIEPR